MQSEPSNTQAVRESVALLVAEHGIEGTEHELQRRFREQEDIERTLKALAVLRREYMD